MSRCYQDTHFNGPVRREGVGEVRRCIDCSLFSGCKEQRAFLYAATSIPENCTLPKVIEQDDEILS